MPIEFPNETLFSAEGEEKVSLRLPEDMMFSLTELGELLGYDRSKMIRWCIEQVLREAIEQGKIPDPRSRKSA
jgi:metal-responsive CopG/Arc/MetJ family transcriptional regulator